MDHLLPIQRQLEVFCFRALSRRDDVQDTLQAAIANAYRDFDLYAEGTNFRAWIFQYVTFESLNRNRTHQKLKVRIDQREVNELAARPIDAFRWEALLDAPQELLEQLLNDSGVARAVETSAPRRRLTRPLLTLTGLAASILLVVVSWSLRSGSGDTIPSLLQESISVHRFIASGSLRPNFESKSDVEVDRYLVSKASFPVRCPPRLDSGFEVHGAGMHQLEGRPMVYVVGHIDSQPTSIFVLPKDHLQLIPRENQPESERRVQLQTTPEWLVAYAVVDQNLILVVGNAPREKLEKVLSSYGTYPHES